MGLHIIENIKYQSEDDDLFILNRQDTFIWYSGKNVFFLNQYK